MTSARGCDSLVLAHVRARFAAVERGHPVHVHELCSGEVELFAGQARRSSAQWRCHGCNRSVPDADVALPYVDRRTYAEDLGYVLSLLDRPEEGSGTAAKRPERIAQAAIRVGEVVSTLPPPNRHHSIMHAAVYYCRDDRRDGGGPVEHFVSPLARGEQGFVTDSGRFVDRVEALAIARAAGQCVRETAPHVGLFSEDLW